MPCANYFHRLTGFDGKSSPACFWQVAHFGDKDTFALGADQLIHATVLHLDRRFEALT